MYLFCVRWISWSLHQCWRHWKRIKNLKIYLVSKPSFCTLCMFLICVWYIFLRWQNWLFVANCILCIQHNFTLLQEELPGPDHATAIMEYVLDKSAISEIENCSGKIRQKSKLVKKILEGREYSCRELLRVIEVCLKRSDLITTMEINSAEKLKRGNVMFALCTL